MLDALAETATYVGENLAVPMLAGAGVSFVTSGYLTVGRARGEVEHTDRRAAELNEDVRRWVPDRDRVATARINELAGLARQAAPDGGSSGALKQGAGKVYRAVLHEYRDHLTDKSRELDALLAVEGWAHRRIRRKRGADQPRLMLPPEALDIVDRWREQAEADPSDPAREPRIAGIERASRAKT